MFRSLSRRFRSIAFYRDEMAIVAVGVAHQLLVAGVSLPGVTVAAERDMVVRIADVHAVAAVQASSHVRHTVHAVRVAPIVPSATFEMPALPVPELEAARMVVPRAPRAPRAPRVQPVAPRFRVVTPASPKAYLAPVAPAVDLGADLSESALRGIMERAEVEARVRAAVARALAAEHATRRLRAADVN